MVLLFMKQSLDNYHHFGYWKQGKDGWELPSARQDPEINSNWQTQREAPNSSWRLRRRF